MGVMCTAMQARLVGAEVIAIDEGDGERLRHRLESEWSKGPFDFLYERYALGASAGAEFATDRALPCWYFD